MKRGLFAWDRDSILEPKSEWELQFKTTGLRNVVEKQGVGAPAASSNLLADITYAIMAAAHWAAPAANYDDPEEVKAMEEEDPALRLKRKPKAAHSKNRSRFIKYIKIGDRWRSSKMEKAIEIIQGRSKQFPDKGILVFSLHFGVLDILDIALEKVLGIKALRIDGTVSHKHRKMAMEKFKDPRQTANKVLLLTFVRAALASTSRQLQQQYFSHPTGFLQTWSKLGAEQFVSGRKTWYKYITLLQTTL